MASLGCRRVGRQVPRVAAARSFRTFPTPTRHARVNHPKEGRAMLWSMLGAALIVGSVPAIWWVLR